MLAQVSLTPAESKKLIAKGVVGLDVVKRAFEAGLVALHPSSSTYFVYEELSGRKPDTNVWVCGVIVPKGACVEMATWARSNRTPGTFPHSWVFDRGVPAKGVTFEQLFDRMGPDDVYIKGANALDPEGNAGVLAGNPVMEGGTFATVLAASRRKGFTVIVIAGLEKLIPIPVRRAAAVAKRKGYEYAMGVACSLIPCTGVTTMTEISAIRALTGVDATPIAAGGLAGAEGAVTMVLSGDRAAVLKTIEIAEQVKGATSPDVRTSNCHECAMIGSGLCTFPLGDKHWVKM